MSLSIISQSTDITQPLPHLDFRKNKTHKVSCKRKRMIQPKELSFFMFCCLKPYCIESITLFLEGFDILTFNSGLWFKKIEKNTIHHKEYKFGQLTLTFDCYLRDMWPNSFPVVQPHPCKASVWGKSSEFLPTPWSGVVLWARSLRNWLPAALHNKWKFLFENAMELTAELPATKML